MTQRPILFNDAMVRAILDGRKRQTRRVVKLTGAGRVKAPGSPRNWHLEDPDAVLACPFGLPGDRLWVRETWSSALGAADLTPREIVAKQWPIWYRSDSARRFLGACEGGPAFMAREQRWRPSIHMPRWASRITLDMTGVRIERLNDISRNDACWEGLAELSKDGSTMKYGIPDKDGLPGTDDIGWPWHLWRQDPREAYANLWESINGPGSWDANPWVWVVEFRRVA